jgi:hypothetical protein
VVRCHSELAVLALALSLSIACVKSPTSPELQRELAARRPAPSSTTGTLAQPQGGPITISAVSPTRGIPAETVTVEGTGFAYGITVMLDGVEAQVVGVRDTTITVIAPRHAAGMVDVVVTNSGGYRATLPGGFTYELVSLVASPSRVRPGDKLTVSWVAPGSRSPLDWISLFKIDAGNLDYGWYEYTNGAPSGSVIFAAPGEGEYEFRYLLNDSYHDTARSGPITVRSGP